MRAIVSSFILLALLTGCTTDLGVGNYAFVVHEKYNHLKCPEIKGQITAASANITRLEGLQAKAGRSSVGSLLGGASYGPELTESHGNLRTLRNTYAQKNCDAELNPASPPAGNPAASKPAVGTPARQ